MKLFHLLTLAALLAMMPRPGAAQAPAPEDGFTSENAVLDTSIPFAIGAREARQELRGAFGWPTFQEGMVEGVYFRFDPDGYARFAPTPRLDSDIFEVICRPRTLSCMGRKGVLTLFLNARGQFELRIDGIAESDHLFLAEGVSEIQLPEQVLMPLTMQLETLLSSGGELVLRREGAEKARISLTGFSAVAAYLRWVAAKQDYTVLPRGWPVPNSTGLADGANLTRPQDWNSPMPQPQAPYGSAVSSQMAEVRGELNVMRDLLLQRSGQPSAAGHPSAAGQAPPVGGTQSDLAVAALEHRLMALQRQLEIGRMNDLGLPQTPPSIPALIQSKSAPTPTTQEAAAEAPKEDAAAKKDAPAETEGGSEASEGERIARQIAYLITEIGLDPQTAVLLLQMRDDANAARAPADDAGSVRRLLEELGLHSNPVANVPMGVLPGAQPQSYGQPQVEPQFSAQTQAPLPYGQTEAPLPYSQTQAPLPYGQTQAPLPYGQTQVAQQPHGQTQNAVNWMPNQTDVRSVGDRNDYMLLTDYFRSVTGAR